MRLRNSDGAPVDPVPFYVVAATAFLVCFAFGPLYGMAVGASLTLALVGSGLVFVGTTVGAYYRLVRQHNPEGPRAPAEVRLRNILYAAAVLVGLMLLLALPLL
jgi:hypothetical protein